MRSSSCFYKHWSHQKKPVQHNQTHIKMIQIDDDMDTINANVNKDYILAFVNAANNWWIFRTDEQLYTVSSCPNRMESIAGEATTDFLFFFSYHWSTIWFPCNISKTWPQSFTFVVLDSWFCGNINRIITCCTRVFDQIHRLSVCGIYSFDDTTYGLYNCLGSQFIYCYII